MEDPIVAIMEQQAANVTRKNKITKDDNLSCSFDFTDDNGKESSNGDKEGDKLSPGKGKQSLGNDWSSRSAKSNRSCCWGGFYSV